MVYLPQLGQGRGTGVWELTRYLPLTHCLQSLGNTIPSKILLLKNIIIITIKTSPLSHPQTTTKPAFLLNNAARSSLVSTYCTWSGLVDIRRLLGLGPAKEVGFSLGGGGRPSYSFQVQEAELSHSDRPSLSSLRPRGHKRSKSWRKRQKKCGSGKSDS